MNPVEQNLIILMGAVLVLVISFRSIVWLEAPAVEGYDRSDRPEGWKIWALLLACALFAAACGTALIAGANLVTALFGRDPSRTSDSADGLAVAAFLGVTMGAFLLLVVEHFSTWGFRVGRLGLLLFTGAFVLTSWVDVVNSPPR
ncbi:MAG TPA: hypothetical protein VEM41_02025 [Actinomycetota bacterium]|nr:hypothetical protein [Actinomycetota bacterium]